MVSRSWICRLSDWIWCIVSCIAPRSLSHCAIRSGLKADEIFSNRSLVFVRADFREVLLSAGEASASLLPSPFRTAAALNCDGFSPATFDPACEAMYIWIGGVRERDLRIPCVSASPSELITRALSPVPPVSMSSSSSSSISSTSTFSLICLLISFAQMTSSGILADPVGFFSFTSCCVIVSSYFR